MFFSRWYLHALCGAICVLAAWQGETAFGQRGSQRGEVSWVNSKIPNSPGLTHHVLKSEAMGHDVGYVVWRPKDYDASGKTRYPVVYFLHGMGGSEASDSGGFSGLNARGVRAGNAPPAICVFPNGGRSGYREEVEKMIVEELVPLIDKEYPTAADAKQRVVAGLSMGGAGAVRLSMLHPELFSAAGSWGGGLWRDADAILAAADSGAEQLQKNQFKALLINGDRDRPEAFAPLVKKLEELKVPYQVEVLKETPHNLGLYYERSGETMIKFLGDQLSNQQQANQ